MHSSTRHSTRYILHPTQRQQIEDVAVTLPPDQAHSFVLRVSQILQLSCSARGHASNELITRAISRALQEVAA